MERSGTSWSACSFHCRVLILFWTCCLWSEVPSYQMKAPGMLGRRERHEGVAFSGLCIISERLYLQCACACVISSVRELRVLFCSLREFT